jgi:TetR/AcrR family transcriptional regulator, cholesterol catabolism regulator
MNADASGDDPILEIVVELLESEGYDAVQLREVARRARVSLATIYKRHGTRDELILAALQKWMADNRFAAAASVSPAPEESLGDGLQHFFRALFEPWEKHPAMLEAFYRVRSSPAGQRLFVQGLDAVGAAGLRMFADVDRQFVADVDATMSSLVYGLLGRFVAREIEITDIVPTLERTVHWMALGHEAAGTAPPRRRRSRR